MKSINKKKRKKKILLTPFSSLQYGRSGKKLHPVMMVVQEFQRLCFWDERECECNNDTLQLYVYIKITLATVFLHCSNSLEDICF